MSPSSERRLDLERLQERLGHHFQDFELLERALTHVSDAHEDPARGRRHNEPLEFLGDSVLGFLVAVMLHRHAPDGGEGTKSKLKAHLVSAASLARRAAALGLPELLRLGRGEEKTGGRAKTALWGDAYEAVIAALYLDGGIDAAQRFVESEFGSEIVTLDERTLADFKTRLQERLQAQGRDVPRYVVVEELGPSHRRRFRVQCMVDGEPVAEGEGHSKKEAQQDAARQALERLEPTSDAV